ncbi:spoU rRNA Methylase family protein [bacterium BMS3Bbin10]|nr:spoU rRNA Methylase family protein [bacterium BMS3Bbin10]
MQDNQHAPPAPQGRPRGYFAIGVERISKQLNLGNMVRSAHAFGASFVFTVGAHYKATEARADTSKALQHMPLYHWDTPGDMALPRACRLVGVELAEGALDLPSFRHPLQAAYILGPERGELSPEILGMCDHVVKIPTAFCINVAMAGAIVMYDRACTLGRFSPRPVGNGGAAQKARQAHGAPKSRQTTRRQGRKSRPI